MSNIDFSVKPAILTPARIGAPAAGRSNRQKIQFAVNVLLISAAFLFVTAAVLGLFPR